MKPVLLLVLSGCLCYDLVERGQKFSDDPEKFYLVYLQEEEGKIVSPWHDVPLYKDNTSQTYNMIVEIPRFSQAKFEISRPRKLNPIVQDREEGRSRYLPNVFPWHGHLCNYGALPQTWENPFHTDPWTGLLGDRDPLDVCEIGSNTFSTGSVVSIKVLGILGLLDRGETDWKVIAINALEAKEKNVESIQDVASIFPELLETVRHFFKVYKVPDGNSENKFAFDGEFRNADFAQDVIRFTHDHWLGMMANCSLSEEFSAANTQQDNECSLTVEEAMKEVESQAPHNSTEASHPGDVDSWSYVKTDNSGTLSLRQSLSLLLGPALLSILGAQLITFC